MNLAIAVCFPQQLLVKNSTSLASDCLKYAKENIQQPEQKSHMCRVTGFFPPFIPMQIKYFPTCQLWWASGRYDWKARCLSKNICDLFQALFHLINLLFLSHTLLLFCSVSLASFPKRFFCFEAGGLKIIKTTFDLKGRSLRGKWGLLWSKLNVWLQFGAERCKLSKNNNCSEVATSSEKFPQESINLSPTSEITL